MEERQYTDGTRAVEIGPLNRLLSGLPGHLQDQQIRCVTIYPLTEQHLREEYERQLAELRAAEKAAKEEA